MAANELDLLKGLTQEEADRILSLGSRMVLSSGAELFQLGDEANCLYLLTRGRILLTLPMKVQGLEQQVLVEERTPGQTVGWSALIPPYKFTLNANAPLQSEVITLGRTALNEHFANQPAVGYKVALNLAAVIGQRLQLFQAMWLREMQRVVEMRGGAS